MQRVKQCHFINLYIKVTKTHSLIPDTATTLFATLLWGKPFQLEQHCLIKEVHALSSFIAEDAIFDFSLGGLCNNHVVDGSGLVAVTVWSLVTVCSLKLFYRCLHEVVLI